MKTIDDFIKEHDIPENYELERFIESFYDNPEDVTKLKSAYKKLSICEDNNQTPQNIQKVKRIILLGEMRFKSLRKVAPKLDYADPTKLSYEMKNGKIKVDDGEYKFTVDESDKEGTIVFVRSGYKDPHISFLINSIIKMGITVINDPNYVNVSNNKYLLANLLQQHDIPQPKFVLVSKSDIHKGDDDDLQDKLKKIYRKLDDDTKFVCKILGGHGGRGVFICKKSNITSVLQTFFAIDEECKILVQEFCEIEEGDIRVHVLTLNGKQEIVSVTMRAKGGKDFRTNLSLGNSQINDIKLTPEQKKIALDTAKASGLIWCGVDLLPLKNGKTYVIEYNGAPGPPSELTTDQETLEKTNEEFYTNLIDTINKLC